jgi:predicted acyltransferase
MGKPAPAEKLQADRLISLDAFRGLTMFLLVAEGAGLWRALLAPYFAESVLGTMAVQFTHHPWNGLRFWDLVQPFFMFIVGVAMPFAIARRREKGAGGAEVLGHVLYRSAMLFLLGVLLHCAYAGRLVWELWNVLTQLSFTYLVAYLLMRWSAKVQIGASLGLLLATELLYRFWAVPGFDEPFVKDRNFGSFMDLVLMGKLNNGGGWVAVNCVPTAAHTIWGVLAGRLLMSSRSVRDKIKWLVIPGLIAVAVGYGLDPITPIIKRISTSSFVIVSGGWCLLTLALFYWLIDVRRYRRWSRFAVIVGMNSIFIYLFSNTVGPQWLNGFLAIFTRGFMGPWVHEAWVVLATGLFSLGVHWYLCYWLYRRGILIKI